MSATTHYTIELISPKGEPKAPQKAADVFTQQCGVLVRDRIPITVREWNKRKGAPESENVCSFHWILLDIQVYKGRVEVMDPLRRRL